MRTIASLLAMTACLALAVPAYAGGGCGVACGGDPCCGTPTCCALCGSQAACRQVQCQIVCDYEEVEIKCWGCECEDYCLPVPVLGSCLDGCKSCGNSGCNSCCDVGCGCGSCGLDLDLGILNNRCRDGKCSPAVTCGFPRVKKKLMLRTVTVKKPVYKCVTKYVCGGCEADVQKVEPQESAPAPKAAPSPNKEAPLPPAPKQAAMPVLPRF